MSQIWWAGVSPRDLKKSQWKLYAKTNRKSAILNLLCDFWPFPPSTVFIWSTSNLVSVIIRPSWWNDMNNFFNRRKVWPWWCIVRHERRSWFWVPRHARNLMKLGTHLKRAKLYCLMWFSCFVVTIPLNSAPYKISMTQPRQYVLVRGTKCGLLNVSLLDLKKSLLGSCSKN